MEVAEEAPLAACENCGLVQRLEGADQAEATAAACARCGSGLCPERSGSLIRTRCLALAALVFFVPANLLPVAVVDHFGRQAEVRIFDGIRELFAAGMYVIGCIVFATSIVTPLIKILVLLFLSFGSGRSRHRRFRTYLYHLIRNINSWNAMEMYLLTMLIGLAEFGNIVSVSAGIGAVSFATVVILTTVASITFHPEKIWES